MKRINGRLREINGFYHTVINYPDSDGKMKQKSQTTRLKTKGNKKRAQEILNQRLAEFEEMLEDEKPVDLCNIRFTDFMKDWLNIIENTVEITTYASYKKSY